MGDFKPVDSSWPILNDVISRLTLKGPPRAATTRTEIDHYQVVLPPYRTSAEGRVLPSAAPSSEDPLAMGRASELTKRALVPGASVADRRNSANQFTERFRVTNPFTSRKTTIERDDAAQALLLFWAESRRADRDPETLAKLQEVLLQGIDDAAVHKNDPEAVAFAQQLAEAIAGDSSMAPETRIAAARKVAELGGAFSPNISASDFAAIARRTLLLFEDIGINPTAPPEAPGRVPLNDLRIRLAERCFELAQSSPGEADELRLWGTCLAYNLPTQPSVRRIMVKLGLIDRGDIADPDRKEPKVAKPGNGKDDDKETEPIKPEQLSREDAKTVLAILKAYPPTLALVLDKGNTNAAKVKARVDFRDALEKHIAELDEIYSLPSLKWTPDSPIEPGSPDHPNPAADQAFILDVAARARENAGEGKPLNARSLERISPTDTDKCLRAIANYKAANRDLFTKSPPDEAAKQTRDAIEKIEDALGRHKVIQNLTARIDILELQFKKMQKDQGVVGITADFLKNKLGVQDGMLIDSKLGSEAVEKLMRELEIARAKIDELRDRNDIKPGEFGVAVKEILTTVKEQHAIAYERVLKYAKSQSAWVDGISDFAAVTAAIAAAPITEGTSLSVVVSVLVGAVTKVGIKGLDAVTGSGKYDGNLFLDLLKGGLGGGSGLVATRLAELVARTTASRLAGLMTPELAKWIGGATGLSAAGTADGFFMGTASPLIDGAPLEVALKNGLVSSAFGALLGPLVAGVARVTRGAAQRVSVATLGQLERVPLSWAAGITEARVGELTINRSNIALRELPEGIPPFARVGPTGKVEIWLPVGKNGTVSGRDLARVAEHIKLSMRPGSEARMRYLSEADQAAEGILRIQKELAITEGPVRAAVEARLRQAIRRFEMNPLVRETMSAASANTPKWFVGRIRAGAPEDLPRTGFQPRTPLGNPVEANVKIEDGLLFSAQGERLESRMSELLRGVEGGGMLNRPLVFGHKPGADETLFYVMDANGQFHIAPREEAGLYRSTGAPAAAGEIVVHNGVIMRITGESRYYHITGDNLWQAVQELRSRGVYLPLGNIRTTVHLP